MPPSSRNLSIVAPRPATLTPSASQPRLSLRHPPFIGRRFGVSLTAWNFGKTTLASGEPLADLAIGVPLEDAQNPDDPAQAGLVFSDVGAAAVLYSNSGGLSSIGDQLWTQGSPNVPDSPEAGDQFGRALYYREPK